MVKENVTLEFRLQRCGVWGSTKRRCVDPGENWKLKFYPKLFSFCVVFFLTEFSANSKTIICFNLNLIISVLHCQIYWVEQGNWNWNFWIRFALWSPHRLECITWISFGSFIPFSLNSYFMGTWVSTLRLH